jgi:integrase
VFGEPVPRKVTRGKRKGQTLPVGSPLDKAHLLRRFRAALKAAKVSQPLLKFHELRHTFGTQMAAHGVPMRTLQEWMGHRDIKTTERYVHYAPKTRDSQIVSAAFSLDAAPSGGAPSEAPIEVTI